MALPLGQPASIAAKLTPIKASPAHRLYIEVYVTRFVLSGAAGEICTMRRTIMQQLFRAYLITLVLVAGIDLTVVSFDSAAAQGSQQLSLNSAQEQAVTQGLANQPTQSVPGFSGQIGSKLPSSETAQPLPSDVQAQVPEAKEMLFIKLPDRILLIDPDSRAVAEIVMAPLTTGSSPASTESPAR
jgi:hypothetical protein